MAILEVVGCAQAGQLLPKVPPASLRPNDLLAEANLSALPRVTILRLTRTMMARMLILYHRWLVPGDIGHVAW